MRMRRKNNLEERLNEQNKKIIARQDYSFFYNYDKQKDYFLNFKQIFKNDNPVHMEIGCGKGTFVIQKAIDNPNINYVAVEKISNVLLTALENEQSDLPNLKFMNCDAQILPIFIKKNSVEKIYLNFSCPYPKKTYKNRRLTYKTFLNAYKQICVDNFIIEQKTDNVDFFDFSLEQYEQNAFTVLDCTYDLYGERGREQVKQYQTEYEKSFMGQGKKICYVKVKCN